MLKLERVQKLYRTEEVETQALEELSLQIHASEFVAIMGPSGCGKSTLLNILGLIDRPTKGSYWFHNIDVTTQTEGALTALRRDHIGFVFQSFNLIDELTVAENIEVALIYRKVRSGLRQKRVSAALERVGLAHRSRHRPQQLSGGQQQRVAVARALVSEPDLILADEPTGNLDTANGDAVMTLLSEVAMAGVTVVMVTHSLAHAGRARRTIQLLDGRLVSDTVLSS